MNARTPKIAIPALLCAVVLASCGGSGSSATSVSDRQSPEPEPVERTSTSDYSPASFTPSFWVTENLEQSDGSTARQRFGLGDLSPAEGFDAPNGYESLMGACEINRGRDALIPGVLIVDDTTERFPIELNTGVAIERPFQDGFAKLGPETTVAHLFSSGSSCAFEDEAQSNEVTVNLTDGETGRHRFLLVVHNYYSPRHPEGNEEGLRFLRVGFFPYAYGEWSPLCESASAPLHDGVVRPDGKPINEQDYETYETSPYSIGSSGLPRC